MEKIFFLFFLHLGSIAFHYYIPLYYCVLAYSASLPGKLKAALSSEMRALHLANSQSESKSVKTIVCFLYLYLLQFSYFYTSMKYTHFILLSAEADYSC